MVGRIFFARSIVQTYVACSAIISGSNGKLGVVAIKRTTELGLPLGAWQLGSELGIVPSGCGSLLG